MILFNLKDFISDYKYAYNFDKDSLSQIEESFKTFVSNSDESTVRTSIKYIEKHTTNKKLLKFIHKIFDN